MAYPPSVVVKDYTWNGSAGYLVRGWRQREALQDHHSDRPALPAAIQ